MVRPDGPSARPRPPQARQRRPGTPESPVSEAVAQRGPGPKVWEKNAFERPLNSSYPIFSRNPGQSVGAVPSPEVCATASSTGSNPSWKLTRNATGSTTVSPTHHVLQRSALRDRSPGEHGVCSRAAPEHVSDRRASGTAHREVRLPSEPGCCLRVVDSARERRCSCRGRRQRRCCTPLPRDHTQQREPIRRPHRR